MNSAGVGGGVRPSDGDLVVVVSSPAAQGSDKVAPSGSAEWLVDRMSSGAAHRADKDFRARQDPGPTNRHFSF